MGAVRPSCRCGGSLAVGFTGLLLLCVSLLEVSAQGVGSLIQLPRTNGSRKRRQGSSKFVLSVDDFGALGDGVTDDTQAFSDAWDAACSLPARTVLNIPSGKTYLVGPIDFGGSCMSKITLLISGSIIAPDDPTAWDNWDPKKWLYFHNVNHLILRGGGTINGMGEKWWAQSCKVNRTNPCKNAPKSIIFHKCTNLRVHGLLLLDSQQFHMSFTNCFKVKASSLKVIAPAGSPNTDGIHVSDSSSVVIRDSIIKTGDDCISIVGNTSKVQIKNIVCGPGHGISIGSLGKANAWDEVHDIQVNGAIITDTQNGLRIKSWQGGRGFARDISFENVFMRNVSHPIIIDQYYCDSFIPCANQTDAVRVIGISFNGIKGTSATKEAIRFACSDSYPCEDILLQDIQLSLASGGNATAFCWNAIGFDYGILNPVSCLSSCETVIKQKIPPSFALQHLSV